MEDGPNEMVKLLGINKLENFRDLLSSDQWFKTLRVRPPVNFKATHAPEPISDDIGSVYCSSMASFPVQDPWDCPQEEKISYGDVTYHTSSLERRSADVLDEILEEVKVTEKPKPAPALHARGIPTKLVTTMGDPRRMGLAQ